MMRYHFKNGYFRDFARMGTFRMPKLEKVFDNFLKIIVDSPYSTCYTSIVREIRKIN